MVLPLQLLYLFLHCFVLLRARYSIYVQLHWSHYFELIIFGFEDRLFLVLLVALGCELPSLRVVELADFRQEGAVLGFEGVEVRRVFILFLSFLHITYYLLPILQLCISMLHFIRAVKISMCPTSTEICGLVVFEVLLAQLLHLLVLLHVLVDYHQIQTSPLAQLLVL